VQDHQAQRARDGDLRESAPQAKARLTIQLKKRDLRCQQRDGSGITYKRVSSALATLAS
jgi:hypothetical protein